MATIRKHTLKNGKIVYDFQVKRTDKGSGEQIFRTMRWHPDEGMTPKQAERASVIEADKFEKEVEESISGCAIAADTPNITFRAFADKWLEKTEREHSLIYYVKAQKQLTLAYKYIGGYKLRELTPAIIQNFYDKLDTLQKVSNQVFAKPDFRETLLSYGFTYKIMRYDYKVQACSLAHMFDFQAVSLAWAKSVANKIKVPFDAIFIVKTTETPYAYETINQIKRTVRAVLAVAKKNRLVQDNYASADYINFPKKVVTPIQFLDDEEAIHFYDTCMSYPDIRYKTAMLIFLLTGFRRGEVAGLEWKDIDFDNKTITVERSLVAVSGHGVILKDPKTETSKRTISIAQTLVDVLKEYKVYWEQIRADLGDYMMESDRLFTKENGDRISPGIFLMWLKKMLKDAELEHHTLHSLRHTNITMQIAAGVPLVTVSGRAGHARTSTTSDIYAHFLKTSDKEAAEIVDSMFKHKKD